MLISLVLSYFISLAEETKKRHVIKLKKGVGRDAEIAEANCSGPVFVISSIMQIIIILAVHFLLAGRYFELCTTTSKLG